MNARLPPQPRRAAAKAPATRDPRRSARRRLLAEGDVRIKTRGGRRVARAPRCPPVAFWPATGRWAARGGPTRRGLRKLLDFLRHNR